MFDSDAGAAALAARLTGVSGVVGVTLGGSRARSEHVDSSDVDMGLYYRQPLDTEALGELAREVAGVRAEVTEPGRWGPWVDGGAWLQIEGVAVDWIYRDIGRVQKCWSQAQRGVFSFHAQTGHPFGVPDFAYAGEVALGVVLADPTGELTALHGQTQAYPPALTAAVLDCLFEADFLVAGLRKSIHRADSVWAAGCLFRVVLLCVHALHARAGRWLINEKGALASAGALPVTPKGFTARAAAILGHVGESPTQLMSTISLAAVLVEDTRTACAIS
jgi:predicted nucleotidyltransferase